MDPTEQELLVQAEELDAQLDEGCCEDGEDD